jgi:glutathione S-transferase
MTLRIYGVAKSRVFRVLWAAKELGLAYEHVEIDFSDGPSGVRSPAFLAINPNGQVPAIDDDGFVLTESLAINLYLARKAQGAPATARDEARALQWSFWAATQIEAALISLARHRVQLPPEQRSANAADAAEAQLERPLALLDRALAAQPFLAGDGFGIADLNVASVLYGCWRLGLLKLEHRPHLAAWLERCLARPAALEARALRE